MRFNYYNNDELEFYIYVLDTLLEEYENKVESDPLSLGSEIEKLNRIN